jgi:hypothetical protein
MKAPVTAYVSSKDRYFTTLPSCILSILHQTVKPERFILFMDGEHIDLRNNDLYVGLFKILDILDIQWEVVFSPRKGQVLNHQLAIDMSQTKWIWRNDDDTFAEPTVLEKLLACGDDDKVGAVAGLVINPSGSIEMLPQGLTPTLENIGANVQWFTHPSLDPIESEHLYSTFLFKKEAASHGYCKDLSPVGHREETIFTYEMFRNGWKLIVTPKAITWHVKQGQGGIRSFHNNPEHWDHDEKVFKAKLQEWHKEVVKSDVKLIVLDNGMGDHIMFKTILPEIKEKYSNRKIILGVCYPEIFEDDHDVKLISIHESKEMCSRANIDYENFNIYKFCIDRNWKRSLIDAFRKMYLEALQ